jgi:hypothetical protein
MIKNKLQIRNKNSPINEVIKFTFVVKSPVVLIQSNLRFMAVKMGHPGGDRL